MAARNVKPLSRDLGSEAYARLKAEIRDGSILPGARVTETDLSARLKMSRTPIREAIYRLEADGLLTHEPRRGLTVMRPDHQMVMELYTMRESLEGTAARLAAQHASDAEIEALGGLVAREATKLTDARSLQQLNQQIHGLIYLAAHNRFLLKSLENLESTTTLLPTMLGDPERAREAHEEHLAILHAIQARDTDLAETAAQNHMRTARRLRLNTMLASDMPR